jgi:hypothetical protein
MEMLTQTGMHSHISEQAKNLARLADRVPDRKIKLHLIGVALGLLGLLDQDQQKLELSPRS